MLGIFGSFASGLYLPNSDIDVLIEEPEIKRRYLIREIAEILKKHSHVYKDLEVIAHAKVPVIKAVHIQTGVNIDIVFNEFSGLAQINQFRNAMTYYPEFKFLYLIIKLFLRQRGLNTTYRGGIGIISEIRIHT